MPLRIATSLSPGRNSRMPLPWTRNRRQEQRMQRIAQVLLRHGLGYVAAQLGLPQSGRPGATQPAPDGLPGQVREVMEELGPTYIKLGQMLSTRADILPPAWIEELAQLQDRVPPFPTDEARAVIES